MSREIAADLDEALGTRRGPRETRDTTARVKPWLPPQLLPEPDKQPGYVYRWVRVTTPLGKPDASNISSKFREGWEPVRVEEQPQYKVLVDTDSRFKDNIEVSGLLLCKAPKETMQQRKAYYASKNQAQVESVDSNFLRESDSRMPLFREKRTATSFGRGN